MSAHQHDHHHHHHHGSVAADFTRAFAIGITLNIIFVGIEASYGYYSNSLALVADAGHNLSDVLGLAIAWGAAVLAKRRPSLKYTYGLRGTSILAALFNALFLLVAVGGIVWESILRFSNPSPVQGWTVVAVAAVGIVVNGLTALLFMSGKKDDLNIRGAYLHMVADALVSFGVVIAGLLILWTQWSWIDPIISLLISGVIVVGTWHLLKGSVELALDAVPSGVEPEKIKSYLQAQAGVERIHDLHVWGISTTENALTVHLVTPAGHPGDEFLSRVCHKLAHDFNIQHATLQIELGNCGAPCSLEPVEN